MNTKIFELFKENLKEELFPTQPQYMSYGWKALNSLKDKISSYLAARLGINNLLWSLEEIDKPFKGSIDNVNGIYELSLHMVNSSTKCNFD